MRAPLILVTATLTVAILLAVSLLIVTGARGESAPVRARLAVSRILPVMPGAT
jgi:hypothetical protein